MWCFFFVAYLTFVFSAMKALQQNLTGVGWNAFYNQSSDINY